MKIEYKIKVKVHQIKCLMHTMSVKVGKIKENRKLSAPILITKIRHKFGKLFLTEKVRHMLYAYESIIAKKPLIRN